MLVALLAIVVVRRFQSRVAATSARAADCIAALDGSCAGAAAAATAAAAAATAAPTAAPAVSPASSSDGIPLGPVGSSPSLAWGAPGFSQGWTASQRNDYLGQHGVADPNANYWTPFWSQVPGPNEYTGSPDTSARNTFAAIHDYNLARGSWPWYLSYFDVVTPTWGVTHDDLDAALSQLGRRLRRALGLPDGTAVSRR